LLHNPVTLNLGQYSVVVLTDCLVDTSTMTVLEQYICIWKSWEVTWDNLQVFRYVVLIMYSIIFILGIF